MKSLKKWAVQWRYSFKPYAFLRNAFAIFGFFWLLAESTSFFLQPIEERIHDNRYVFAFTIIIALTGAVISVRPRTKFKCLLNNRNVTIEIRVADIFQVLRGFKQQHPAMVVPVNSCFENTLSDRVNASSVQGMLLREFYDSSPSTLDADIKKAIQERPELYSPSGKVKTTIGDLPSYDIGTVVRAEQKGFLFYLLANTRMQPNGKSEKSTRDDLAKALSGLWAFIDRNGEKNEVAIPVLYAGHGRSSVPYTELVQEIIKSFVFSCSERSYCRRLVLVCHLNDVSERDVNIQELYNFLEAQCKYTYLSSRDVTPIGTHQSS